MTKSSPFFAHVGDWLVLLGDTSIQQFAAIINSSAKRTERGWEWPWSKMELIREHCRDLRPLIDQAFPIDRPVDECGDLTVPLNNGRVLYEHQIIGIRRLVQMEWAILADDPGLGKSYTSLVAARIITHKHQCAIILISPVSMMGEWITSALAVGLEVNPVSWAKIPEPPNYPYMVIADEAACAQGGTSTLRGKRFKVLTEDSNCRSAILLTGTPMKNAQPRNIYPLLRAVKAPVALHKTDFERRYCDAKKTKWCRWDTTGATNIDELREACAPYIIRRTKKECLDLPPFTRVMVTADVGSGEAGIYKATLGHIRDQWSQTKKTALDCRGAIDKANGAASLMKVPHAIELAQQIIEAGHKVVIFSNFLEPVRMVSEVFGAAALVLTGETPQAQRKPLTDRFQSDPSVKVWCSTTQAGGVGLTLTAASYVILIDRPWTPGDTNQAEARIDRIGQTLPCTSYWLQFGAVDEARDNSLADKSLRIKQTLGDKEAGIDAISSYEAVDYAALARAIFKQPL